jgi:hypothetical protein
MQQKGFKRLAVLGVSFGLLASPALLASGFAHEQGQNSAIMQLARGKKKPHRPREVMELAAKGNKKDKKPQATMELASKSMGGGRGHGRRKR